MAAYLEAKGVKDLVKNAVKGLLQGKPDDPRSWLASYYTSERNFQRYRDQFLAGQAVAESASAPADKLEALIKGCGVYYAPTFGYDVKVAGGKGISGTGSYNDFIIALFPLYGGCKVKKQSIKSMKQGDVANEIIVEFARFYIGRDETGAEVPGTEFNYVGEQTVSFDDAGLITGICLEIPSFFFEMARAKDTATLKTFNAYNEVYELGRELSRSKDGAVAEVKMALYKAELPKFYAAEVEWTMASGATGKGPMNDFFVALGEIWNGLVSKDEVKMLSMAKGSSSDEVVVVNSRHMYTKDDAGVEGSPFRFEETLVMKYDADGKICSYSSSFPMAFVETARAKDEASLKTLNTYFANVLSNRKLLSRQCAGAFDAEKMAAATAGMAAAYAAEVAWSVNPSDASAVSGSGTFAEMMAAIGPVWFGTRRTREAKMLSLVMGASSDEVVAVSSVTIVITDAAGADIAGSEASFEDKVTYKYDADGKICSVTTEYPPTVVADAKEKVAAA